MTTELKPNQRLFLLTLMARGGNALNSDIIAVVALQAPDRAQLESRGLLQKTKHGRTFALELTDRGWSLARADFTAPAPAGSSATRALYAVLARLGAYMDARRLAAADVFGPLPAEQDAAPAGPGPAEDAIEAAYRALVQRPQGWLRLSALRQALPGFDATTIDTALLGLLAARRVSIEPVVDQKTLTEQDRAAGLKLGAATAHHFAFLD
ncbi:hypothetical protein V5F53_14280 [Xanthobacter sp. V4C-4]|uniref:hypothetical protein n=1 Tax=Xanthobacter cornucopiae TaxID=3119924 RepID=UPI00372C7BD1